MQPASALGASTSTGSGHVPGAVLAGVRRAVVPVLLSLAAVAMEAGLPLLPAPAGPSLARAAAQELPEGVTPDAVEEGRQLFHGPGACVTCHGEGGDGVSGLGPDLTDETWLHVDGSLASLQERIRAGVPAAISRVGVPMPPRGGVRLTDDELRAVAAYVWTLSRRDDG